MMKGGMVNPYVAGGMMLMQSGAGKEIAKTKMVICSPIYCIKAGLKNKVKKIGNIIRCICILDKTIPNTNNFGAC